uniref:Ig-like domain-containing protein n=1 Tax=Panagrolaimus sp. ES5 TaxID=591445 RepID=A0AC34GT15_9BILA
MNQHLIFLLIIFFINELQARPSSTFGLPNINFDTSGAIKQDKVNVIDLLTLKGTSTVLSCDPIFSSEGAKKEAIWYKDGSKIAYVTGERNAVYENRTLNFNSTIPQVGFLILANIKMEYEGDYWCLRKDTGQIGEISRIRVSYITQIEDDIELVATPSRPYEGEMVEIECAFTDAFPAPAVNWLFNGSTLPTRVNYVVASNASLLIYHYGIADMGLYECVLTNFAGSTRTGVTLSKPLSASSIQSDSLQQETNNFLQNSTLMFFIGCLSTACLILIYLFGGMIWYRYSNRRPCHGQISLWQSILRADPALAPGFRKVVAPTPDSARPRLLQTDEI